MGLEISASRLLAPHFGTSVVVWTNVIGVVLLALSLGYYLGGKLAEGQVSPRVLAGLLYTGSLLTLTIPLSAPFLLKSVFINYGSPHIALTLLLGPLIASIVLFGLPVFVMGTISPYLLTLLTQKFGHIGNTSGQLFALSTIGGLLGTFLPTLLFIPWLGTSLTITVFGLILGLISLPHIGVRKKSAQAFLVLVLFTSAQLLIPTHNTDIATTETVYQRVAIHSPREGLRYLQLDSGFGVQSVYNPQSILTGYYYEYTSLLPYLLERDLHKDPAHVLIIGLAGGTIARQMHHFFGNTVSLHAIELDPGVTRMAKTYMGLNDIPIHITHGDGRQKLAADKNTYDLIIVDTYFNDLQIPWTMTTREFWQIVRAHLKPNGIAAMNIAAIGASKSALVEAISNTQAKVFPYVYDAKLKEGKNSNHLVILSLTQQNISKKLSALPPSEIASLGNLLTHELVHVQPQAHHAILTDDHAPIEWLMAKDMVD
jgi:spermidine synthase